MLDQEEFPRVTWRRGRISSARGTWTEELCVLTSSHVTDSAHGREGGYVPHVTRQHLLAGTSKGHSTTKQNTTHVDATQAGGPNDDPAMVDISLQQKRAMCHHDALMTSHRGFPTNGGT